MMKELQGNELIIGGFIAEAVIQQSYTPEMQQTFNNRAKDEHAVLVSDVGWERGKEILTSVHWGVKKVADKNPSLDKSLLERGAMKLVYTHLFGAANAGISV